MQTVNWNIHTPPPDPNAPTPEFIAKVQKGMRSLVQYRLAKSLPFKVLRDLTYQTSIMDTQKDDDDDGFYQVRKSETLGKFVDVHLTIPAGTEICLKSLDPGMNEFIFTESGSGVEHSIPYTSQHLLMSQTDVFEIVKDFLTEQEAV